MSDDDVKDDSTRIAKAETALWVGIGQSKQLAHEAAEVLTRQERRLKRIERRAGAPALIPGARRTS